MFYKLGFRFLTINQGQSKMEKKEPLFFVFIVALELLLQPWWYGATRRTVLPNKRNVFVRFRRSIQTQPQSTDVHTHKDVHSHTSDHISLPLVALARWEVHSSLERRVWARWRRCALLIAVAVEQQRLKKKEKNVSQARSVEERKKKDPTLGSFFCVFKWRRIAELWRWQYRVFPALWGVDYVLPSWLSCSLRVRERERRQNKFLSEYSITMKKGE